VTVFKRVVNVREPLVKVCTQVVKARGLVMPVCACAVTECELLVLV
jgi:hypothetical protein